MKERLSRLKAIKEVIRTERIDSQEVLLDHIRRRGYSVTQATLSRDLKFLKVGKIPDGTGGFFYRLPEREIEKESEDGFLNDIERGFISIAFSGNLGVLHTMPGHANSVAFALDNLEFPQILGTIAGDDTILLILREDVTPRELERELAAKIPELEIEI
jgi:transcriptional regulator of arginine metabolism